MKLGLLLNAAASFDSHTETHQRSETSSFLRLVNLCTTRLLQTKTWPETQIAASL